VNPLWWWLIGGCGVVVGGVVTALVVYCVGHILWVISSGGLEPEPLPNDEDEDN
jgi:hypothetical protein